MVDWWQSDPVAAPASAPAASSWWGNDPVAQAAAAPAPPGDQRANAAFDNATLHGLPVVGPMIFGGLDHVVAGARSAWKVTPYADELASVRAQRDAIEQPMQADHPIATTAGTVAGGVAGTVPLVAAAPTAFGVGAGGMLARTGMSALSGAALGGGDAAVRSGGDLGATAQGAAFGFGAGAATP